MEMRPVVSPGGQTVRAERPASAGANGARGASGARRQATRGGRSGVIVRRMTRGAEDGFRSALVPGLRSGADAQRLAEELAFGATRLVRLAADPPGLYAEVADGSGSIEERTWLAFLIAYLCPLEGEEPFAGIAAARLDWAGGETALPDDVTTGPRTAHEPGRGSRTLAAYRAWAERAGSQAIAFGGEDSWTPERRFSRLFERLALPGLGRGARFDLLASLGRLGVYDLRAQSMGFGGTDPVTVAAKRILGIGDSMMLERRASDLAQACGIPLESLDAGLFSWETGRRAHLGMEPGAEPDAAVLEGVQAALGL